MRTAELHDAGGGVDRHADEAPQSPEGVGVRLGVGREYRAERSLVIGMPI